MKNTVNKPVYILFVAVLVLMLACTMNRTYKISTIGKVELGNSEPRAGETLTFLVNDTASIIDYYLAYSVKGSLYLKDIDFEKMDSVYQGSFVVPDSASFVAINLLDADGQMLDGKVYDAMVYDDNGAPRSGALYGKSIYYLDNAESMGVDCDYDTIFNWMKTEMELHPETKSYVNMLYANLYASVDKEEGGAYLQNVLDSLGSQAKISDSDYEEMVNAYYIIGKPEVGDSIVEMVMAQNPKSVFRSENLIDACFSAETMEMKDSLWTVFVTDYPKDVYVNYLTHHLIYNHLQLEDYDKVATLLAFLGRDYKASAYIRVIDFLLTYTDKTAMAAKYCDESMSVLADMKAHPKVDYREQTMRQYLAEVDVYQAQMTALHAHLLFKKDSVKEAIAEISPLVATHPDDAFYVDRYVSFLMADKQYKEVMQTVAPMVTRATASDDAQKYLQEAFVALYPNKSYADYLDSLATQLKEYKSEELKSQMLNEAVPEWTLVDKDGREYSSTQLKGKVLVLDFWANWCSPCKSSFGAMQKVIDQYKNDKEVLFLFVNTFENTDLEKRISTTQKLMSDNGYSFTVLYDKHRNEQSSKFDVSTKFKVKSIPAKFVIGKDGLIKFKSVGYSSDDDLIAELTAMLSVAAE